MLTHRPWAAIAGLHHGFLDRHESSTAPGWPDVLAALDVSVPIVTARQVHGTTVVRAAPGDALRAADGLIASTGHLAVGVVTADCVPVLLVSRGQRVAAALHAGWRGTAGGILDAALTELRTGCGVDAADLEAVLGPAVGPCCYEVGREVEAAYHARTGDLTRPAWRREGGRLFFDLRAAIRLLLAAAGVPAVTILGPCTACAPAYCSYRRDGPGAGRQLSFVGWT